MVLDAMMLGEYENALGGEVMHEPAWKMDARFEDEIDALH